MNSADQQRIAKLFDAAIKLDPAERARFLADPCNGSPEIRAQVESLIIADAAAGVFLEPPRISLVASADAHSKIRDRCIGPYRFVRWIASGGMGSVYEAVQQSFGRTVALKVIKHGAITDSAIRRLEHEAHLLARLRHPGIAQVLEAGTLSDVEGLLGPVGGTVPYFAMEFIPNAMPITQYAERRVLNVTQRLRLIESVCDAIGHGHQRGIIHRDLKPSNILVIDTPPTENAPTPIIKIIDFGVARATLADEQLSSLHTAMGQLIGTLTYMSPEQCGHDPSDVDLRSDIYSLGVVMYELLCGVLPYQVENLSPLEALRIIQHQSPPHPGTLNRSLRGDLETIMLKAIEKERSRRYQTMGELAADIRRYLDHEPIAARPPSVAYQFRTFARRNKSLVGGVAVAFVLLCAGIIGTSWQLVRARRAERLSEARRIEAEREAYVANIAAADSAIEGEDGGTAMTRLLQAPANLRGWEWQHLRHRADQSLLTLPGPRLPARMASSRDGRFITALYDDGALRCWNATTNSVRWSIARAVPGEGGHAVRALRYSPQGQFIGAVCDADVFIFDSADGRLRTRLTISKENREALNLAFAPDAHQIAVSSTSDVSIWDVDKGVQLRSAAANGYVFGLDFTPEGEIAQGGEVGVTLRNLDLSQASKILAGPEGAGFLYVSPDGSRVAATVDRCVQIWSIATGKIEQKLCGHRHRVDALAWSPDSRMLATGSIDKTIRLWDARTGKHINTLLGHAGQVLDLTFLSDSQLASSSVDGTIRLWNTSHAASVSTLAAGPGFIVPPLTWSREQSRFLSSAAGQIILWDAKTLRPILTIPPLNESRRFRPAALSPDGQFIATCNALSACEVLDARDGKTIWSSSQREDFSYAAFSPDGRLVASPAADHSILAREASSGKILRTLKGHRAMILSICFAPDGNRLVTTSSDGSLRVWNADDRSGSDLVWSSERLAARTFAAWSADGSRIATAGADEVATIWDAATGRALVKLPGLYDGGWSIAFSPDGRRIATGAKDRLIRIWDADTGRELMVLRGHTGTIMALAWSPDGGRLLSGCYNGTVRVWETFARD